MELKAYFSGIHEVIIDHLNAAQSEIVAAIAWFTDRDIFEALCNKARLGVDVTLVLIGDEINQRAGGLNFSSLSALGGQVIFLSPDDGNERLMHHKFCVIDRATVITGSYNWSQRARSNDENITVVTDAEHFARTFLDAFATLVARSGHAPDRPSHMDAEAVRRRLELIRNLILLGEKDELSPHMNKLRPAVEALGIGPILASLEKNDYEESMLLIDAFLHRASAIVLKDDADVVRLRFDLSVLELRLESLNNEKAELERRLVMFNHRHDEALGELIQRVLKARSALARKLASKKLETRARKAAEAEAREAEEAYHDYTKQQDELRKEGTVPSLTPAEEQELKSLYRKGCFLCHPDKLPEEFKEAAHDAFLELQVAYKSNDLSGLRALCSALEAGGLSAPRSRTLHEADRLKAAIAELESVIGQLVAEISALRHSSAYLHLELAGSTESDWRLYFESQRKLLEEELATIEADISKA